MQIVKSNRNSALDLSAKVTKRINICVLSAHFAKDKSCPDMTSPAAAFIDLFGNSRLEISLR